MKLEYDGAIERLVWKAGGPMYFQLSGRSAHMAHLGVGVGCCLAADDPMVERWTYGVIERITVREKKHEAGTRSRRNHAL
jgi:hypothetical protein